MPPALALLPSPFLGPAVWEPVRERLTDRGWHVITPTPAVSPRDPHDVLQAYLAALPYGEDLILVPHSNAGLYVPVIATQRRVRAFVFVDALLPTRSGFIEMAPPAAMLDVLRQKADADGLLPPWTAWWEEADVADLFPDSTIRERVERELPHLPLTYFDGSMPIAAGWDQRPGAYLAFGDTYDKHRTEAEKRGWSVVTLAGAHLHMLVEPVQVASQILAFVASQSRHSGRPGCSPPCASP